MVPVSIEMSAELVGQILELAIASGEEAERYADLRNYALVSKHLNGPAEALLYSSVKIRTPKQCHSFLSAMHVSGRAIKELSISALPSESSGTRRHDDVRTLLEVCSKGGALQTLRIGSYLPFSAAYLGACSSTLVNLTLINCDLHPCLPSHAPFTMPSLVSLSLYPNVATGQSLGMVALFDLFITTRFPKLSTVIYQPQHPATVLIGMRETYPQYLKGDKPLLPSLGSLFIEEGCPIALLPFLIDPAVCCTTLIIEAGTAYSRVQAPFILNLRLHFWRSTGRDLMPDGAMRISCGPRYSEAEEEDIFLPKMKKWLTRVKEEGGRIDGIKVTGVWSQRAIQYYKRFCLDMQVTVTFE